MGWHNHSEFEWRFHSSQSTRYIFTHFISTCSKFNFVTVLFLLACVDQLVMFQFSGIVGIFKKMYQLISVSLVRHFSRSSSLSPCLSVYVLYMCVFVCFHVIVYLNVFVCFACLCVRMSVFVCLCLHVCVLECVCVYMCLCV